MPRPAEARARLTSLADRPLQVAVQAVDPGSSYARVPVAPAIEPARMSRLPLEKSVFDTSRASSVATGRGAPSGSAAVAVTTTVPAAGLVAAVAVTRCTVVCSTPLTCATSPGRSTGVDPAKHTPPGWLTWNRPVESALPDAVAIWTPLRNTLTVTAALGDCWVVMASWELSTKMLWPPAGAGSGVKAAWAWGAAESSSAPATASATPDAAKRPRSRSGLGRANTREPSFSAAFGKGGSVEGSTRDLLKTSWVVRPRSYTRPDIPPTPAIRRGTNAAGPA